MKPDQTPSNIWLDILWDRWQMKRLCERSFQPKPPLCEHDIRRLEAMFSLWC